MMLFCLGMITGIFLYGMINRIPFIIDPVFYDPGMLIWQKCFLI